MGEKVSKYDDLIQELVQEKIEDPNLSIRQFCEDRKVNYVPFFRALKRALKIMETILNGIKKRYHERSIEI